jgi:hypothetical protein
MVKDGRSRAELEESLSQHESHGGREGGREDMLAWLARLLRFVMCIGVRIYSTQANPWKTPA